MSDKKFGFFIEKESMKIVPDADAVGEGFVEIQAKGQLISDYDKEQLLQIRASVFGKNAPVDAKKSAQKIADEIWDEVHKGEDTTPSNPEQKTDEPESIPAEPKEKKETKAQILRRVLKEKGTMTQKDLAEAIGSDTRNTHTMVAILRNPKRTKEPVDVIYNKEEKTYTWPS